MGNAMSDYEDREERERKRKNDERFTKLQTDIAQGVRLSGGDLSFLTAYYCLSLYRNGYRVNTWKHVKSGAYYRLAEHPIVLHENDLVPMVIYRPDDLRGDLFRWARRLDAFLERFVPVQKVEVWEELDASSGA